MTAPPLAAALYILGAVVVAGGTHLLLWHRLIVACDLCELWRRRLAPLFLILSASFPIGMIELLLMRRLPRVVAAPLMWVAFTWLGTVYFLSVGLALFELSRLIGRPGRVAARRFARGCVVGALLLAGWAARQGLTGPAVVKIELRGLPALAGYRIVQLSDLHFGPTIGGAFARDLMTTVNALDADLIVVTGDLVDGSVRALASELAPLAKLHARDGVVFALGNHEHLSGVEDWVAHLTSFGWHVLRNARLSLPRLEVVGLDDASALEADPAARAEATHVLQERTKQRPTLLIAHEPLAFRDACREGIDLALAGHTHGGQIFPMGLLIWLGQGYLAGEYRCGHTRLYVNSGTGYWGPPMRLGSHAEVSLIQIVGS